MDIRKEERCRKPGLDAFSCLTHNLLKRATVVLLIRGGTYAYDQSSDQDRDQEARPPSEEGSDRWYDHEDGAID